MKRRAQELVSLAEKTKQELKQEAELSGEIAIGSGEYQNSRLLAEILAAFQARHPAIQYEIYSGNSDNIKERIERGLLDLGFLLEPVDVSKYEFIRSPIAEEWGFGFRSTPIWRKKQVTPSDLADRPLPFTRRDLIKQELLHWFGKDADKLHIVASGNLPSGRHGRQGVGVFLNLRLDCHYEGLRMSRAG
ncbi:MAG: LysR family transcriptional regulator substrate-binding protein [Christensenellales bacterium]